MQVAPVRLDLAPGRAVGVLTVTNPSTEPMLVQAEGFAWRQFDGEERLDPALELLLSPPIFELAPGAKQLVRVGFRVAPKLIDGREGAWRVWLSQLPDSSEIDPSQGVRMLFRVSLPLFVTPTGAARAQTTWRRDADSVSVSNHGGRHLQLRALALRCDESGRGDAAHNVGMAYVLPDATVRWALPAACRGRTVNVEADSDAGTIRQRLAASTRD